MAEDKTIETDNTDKEVPVNHVANIIGYSQEGNPTQIKSEVGSLIGSKIMDRIETRRQEISADIFGQ